MFYFVYLYIAKVSFFSKKIMRLPFKKIKRNNLKINKIFRL